MKFVATLISVSFILRCASSATIFCNAGVKATNQLGAISSLDDLNYHPRVDISYKKSAHSFDCIAEEYKLCWNSIEKRFKNTTDNFDLTSKDVFGVTLAEAFCFKHWNVTSSKLAFGKSYECASPTNNYAESTFNTDIESIQSIECINGTAIVTGSAAVLQSKISLIVTFLSIYLILMPRLT